ncbi:hypothetical protein X805_32030 [Sphaerotilus natans subsp. natans DSM 6575]|uniref:Uncharacterized protein n=1 Tax=Sphaerotilus natans subsp. natans DSM 6575 TaxID=1286631 RepID=A0A059KJ99_9BURK|nr:hypothetical protein X805_32030 [Sphaerotilus natans subsp. natans DSM 6575]
MVGTRTGTEWNLWTGDRSPCPCSGDPRACANRTRCNNGFNVKIGV